MYTYNMKTLAPEHLRFAIVSTDIIVLRNNNGVIEYATQLVNRPPHYDGIPGFVGGVLASGETALEAAQRIITEKTTLTTKAINFLPLGFYDAVDRDLRGRVVSLAHIGILSSVEDGGLEWYPLYTKKRLAYDHTRMLEDTVAYLSSHLFISTLALYFLPKTFVISELKNIFDYIQGEVVDKRNFYKFIETFPVEATDELKSVGRGRPAQIYKKKSYKNFFLKV
jgi:8-oxo-dGTP diphosphatase